MIGQIQMALAGVGLVGLIGAGLWINSAAYDRGFDAAETECEERSDAAQEGVDVVSDKHAALARALREAEAEVERLLREIEDEAQITGNPSCGFTDEQLRLLDGAAGVD